MSGYRTVVVGKDGSDSSLRAVENAGQIAAGSGAKVIVATAYFPQSEDQRAADVLKDEGYKMSGNAPIYAILREARDRAKAAGGTDIEEKAVVGAPVDALVDLAEEVNADLLVVGNVGLSTIAGRLLGSVPANVARRSKTDVLIVHTTPSGSAPCRVSEGKGHIRLGYSALVTTPCAVARSRHTMGVCHERSCGCSNRCRPV